MAQTKKKTTAKKKTGTKASNTGAKNTTKKTQAEVKLEQEVALIVTFALCVLLFLCNFGIIGSVGNFLSGIMKGLFGITAYVFPIILFGLIIFFLRESGNPSTPKKVRNIISVFLLIIAVVGLIELINGLSKNIETIDIKEMYNYGINEVKGGGLFAGILDFFMIKALGKFGTAIVELIMILLAVFFLTDGAFVDTVKDSVKNSGNYLKESMESSKEAKQQIYLENQEHKKAKQLEKQVEKEKKRENILNEATIGATKESVDPFSSLNSKEAKQARKEDKNIIKKTEKSKWDVAMEDTVIVKSNVTPEEAGNMHEITVNGFNEKELAFSETKGHETLEQHTPEAAPKHAPVKEEVHEVTRDFSHITNKTNIQEENFAKKEAEPHKPDYKPEVIIPKKNEEKTPFENTNAVQGLNRYVKPGVELLTPNKNSSKGDSQEVLNEVATKLVDTLKIFGVDVQVESISKGPTVTRFELQPAPGTKVSKIKGLTDDIKLGLATADIRIEAPVPGKSVIGIEVPNKETIPVLFRDIVESPSFQKESSSNLTFGVGKDIGGNVVVYDIDQFPHLLIAGATGSGKSVCINTLIMSILYKCHPDDVKMIMIDPKVVELRVYDGIPHLLIPVVTDAKKAAAALNAAVNEMMERYRKFAEVNVRDLKGYNSYCEEKVKAGESPDLYKKLPRLIIIVDELADLMMVAKNEVEDSICRLAQLARACGIHLIVATQRPSVDVITGLIKANMPSRLAFAVSSGVDSRTILDMVGAEELLGKGDMLFFPKGLKKPIRLQGAFISDNDVNKVVDYLRQYCVQAVDTSSDFTKKMDAAEISSGSSKSSGGSQASDNPEFDELFMDVAYYIIDSNKASIGNLQRKFKIGFNRAARIMDTLAEHGVVSGEDGTKGRQVLMSREEFENYVEENGL